MIRITGLSVPLEYTVGMLPERAADRLKTDTSLLSCVKVIRQAVDLTDKANILFKLTVDVSVTGDEDPVIWGCHDKGVHKAVEISYSVPPVNPKEKSKNRPVVIGCGPAGLFAALVLAQAGASPVLLERGSDVDSRRRSVEKFWESGVLDPGSNVQFGEGGAGAFSDGKLKIGAMDPCKFKVIDEFIRAGAPAEIAYLEKPHLGTDRLPGIVKSMRRKIIDLGGEVRFHSLFLDILQQDDKVRGLRYQDLDTGNIVEIAADHIILAIGHSARDTYARLADGGIAMKSRPVAVGVRIEHPQHLIDEIRFGAFAGRRELGAADYRMVVHLPDGRGVYTFCMCPGGSVIAAASEQGGLVTNGMSDYRRSGRNANTALQVTVDPREFCSAGPLAGIEFQRKIEKAAFLAGGGGFKAPVQRLEDFMRKRNSTKAGEVLPTYRPGTAFAEADNYLPSEVADSLRQGITAMEEWMPGFAFPDALLTGAETRSSSAVCITRGEDLQALGIKGLYPCGEGAGYSGGILSAAVDGIRCAERVLG